MGGRRDVGLDGARHTGGGPAGRPDYEAVQEMMTKKGVEFARECLIFEVCQPQQAKKVLDENMSVSTALPCRISIYEEGGKTILAALKPTTLLAMFNAPQLEGVAQEVEDTITTMLGEAIKKIT